MSSKTIWYGYLEAGDRSTPVVVDPALNIADAQNIYIYTHSRNAILEYRRDIAEPKLRELKPDEADIGALKKAYEEARQGFAFKGGRVPGLMDQLPAAAGRKTKSEPEFEPELELDSEEEDYLMDDDIEDEEVDD